MINFSLNTKHKTLHKKNKPANDITLVNRRSRCITFLVPPTITTLQVGSGKPCPFSTGTASQTGVNVNVPIRGRLAIPAGTAFDTLFVSKSSFSLRGENSFIRTQTHPYSSHKSILSFCARKLVCALSPALLPLPGRLESNLAVRITCADDKTDGCLRGHIQQTGMQHEMALSIRDGGRSPLLNIK